jgi:hypothetical protein
MAGLSGVRCTHVSDPIALITARLGEQIKESNHRGFTDDNLRREDGSFLENGRPSIPLGFEPAF